MRQQRRNLMDNLFYLATANPAENNHPYVNELLEVLDSKQFPKDIMTSVSSRYCKLWQRAIFSDKPMLFVTADGQKANVLILKKVAQQLEDAGH